MIHHTPNFVVQTLDFVIITYIQSGTNFLSLIIVQADQLVAAIVSAKSKKPAV